jgi:hypothetical protein
MISLSKQYPLLLYKNKSPSLPGSWSGPVHGKEMRWRNDATRTCKRKSKIALEPESLDSFIKKGRI